MNARAGLLPMHGDMTPEQLEGFRIACVCFTTWGRQMEGNSVALGGPLTAMTQVHLMAERGRAVRFVGEALYRTMGHGQIPGRQTSLDPAVVLAGLQ